MEHSRPNAENPSGCRSRQAGSSESCYDGECCILQQLQETASPRFAVLEEGLLMLLRVSHPLALGIGIALSVMVSVHGGEFNQVLSPGDAAPAWSDLPGVDGRQHALDDHRDRAAIVVVFTCNTCPYAIDVEERLIALAKDLEKKNVALVAINPNRVQADRLEAMKERAEEKQFPFAYLHDESQQVARAYGATTTPEFFVLDAQRRIAYMGSLDDSPDGSDVQEPYLRRAVESVLSGETPEMAETVPIGCRIRFQWQRR
jgi:peroxiredoxin